MIIIDWYKEVVLKKYAQFEGRAGKSEFWYFVLGNIIISIVLSIIPKIGGALSGLYSLAVLVPSIAVGVRRLHDIGKSGWNYLMVLIPIAGPIILLIWFIKDGDPAENAFGPVPPDMPEETTQNTGGDTTTPTE